MYYELIEYAIIIIIIIFIIIIIIIIAVVSKSILKESFKLLVWRHGQTGKWYGLSTPAFRYVGPCTKCQKYAIITINDVVIFCIYFMLPNRLWNNVSGYQLGHMDWLESDTASRKHAYIILTPLNPTFI